MEITVDNINYRVVKGAGEPPRRSRAGVWTHLPLDSMEVGDRVDITLHQAEVEEKIRPIRSFVSRTARRNGHKYSVRISSAGVSIWRQS